MMVLTKPVIVEIFDELISGVRTREQAEEWADAIRESDDLHGLEFQPRRDESRLWEAIMYLGGVALKTDPDTYFHSMEEFIEYRRELMKE